ncbi:tyrosine-protein kinase Shark [Eurosta solidaginis]|uniref:tyrosine-protein kinase Shark n=1 Tax=Eurosta solidaginis TaxID=178769 RepID=UPI003530D217
MSQNNEINWFHPGISREDAEKLLLTQSCEDGVFLIRECNSAVGDFVLTLLHQRKVCHYQIRRHGGDAFFSIDDKVKILHGLESLVEFYQMAENGLPTKLTTFLKKDLPPNDARRHGCTNLLHRATKENNATIVCELLKCGYRNVDAKNQNGQTALHLAAIYSDLKLLTLILATEVNVNCMDAFGNMPLHYACRTKSGPFIRHLINANANAQGRNIKNGYVPLHEASKNGNLEAIKELLECHAPLLPRTTSGEFPIDLAREAGHTAVVNFLSDYKLPPAKTKKNLWYHGTLTREEAIKSLQRYAKNIAKSTNDLLGDQGNHNQLDREANERIPIDSSGCFLVRYSDRSGYVLTLLFEGQVKHFIISQSSTYLYIDEGPYLPTLEHLIQHFMLFNDGLPINLKHPVPPEPKPPQPLLATLPRNKCKNRILSTSNSLNENQAVLGIEMNTSSEKKLPDKKRKETTNVVFSNFLKIKSKVSTSSNEKTSESNIDCSRPQHMLEEFPCKGLSFSANFSSVGNEHTDTNIITVNNISLTPLSIDLQLTGMDNMYNIPKNNAAVSNEADKGITLAVQEMQCNDDFKAPDNCIMWSKCDTSEDIITENNNIKEDINKVMIPHTSQALYSYSEWFDSYNPTAAKENGNVNTLSDVSVNYFIPYENVKLCDVIGEGEFGSVYRGRLKSCDNEVNDHKVYREIAIKTLRDEHCRTSKHDFLREASVMFRLKHHCIVQLIGLSKRNNLMMIQELVPLGSMLNFIQNNRRQLYPNRELKLWASQIACGMQYLEAEHFVHRDLAARNILLASLHQAKISDFGLSRALGSDNSFYEARHGGKWPIKWYAPESYKNGIFSHSSDVWSYGVTLWEMFSLGEAPYGDMLGSEAVQLIEDGKRLCQPSVCPPNIYNIMEKCWQYNPKDRPTFRFLMEFFINDPDYQNIMELVKTKSIS